MYNRRLLAFEWKTQQRQWENRAGWLKGHHPVTLDSKALIKIKCVLQTCKRRECESTLCRRRNTSAATNDLVSLCNCSETGRRSPSHVSEFCPGDHRLTNELVSKAGRALELQQSESSHPECCNESVLCWLDNTCRNHSFYFRALCSLSC